MEKWSRAMAMFAFLIIAVACEDQDDLPNVGADLDPVGATTDINVQDFLWKSMNTWYFWQGSVTDLADDRFADNAAYTEYLEATQDPMEFFAGLRSPEDRFSSITEEYTDFTDRNAGVSKSNGVSFQLVNITDTDIIFGYVRYIEPGSDAAGKDIRRGDLFDRVDGTPLTLANYVDLLFGTNDTYTLGISTRNGQTFVPTGREVTLTKLADQNFDPVLLSAVLDVGGIPVGYLMFNSFFADDDEEENLNAIFGQFEAAGVRELVLDMRYNLGGFVSTSRLLSSMIHSTDTDKLFLRERWNDKWQAIFSSQQLEERFADRTDRGTPINSLELTRLYVIATDRTASASELVINGLRPYMQVVHVGETTSGKNEFSFIVVDNPGNDYIYTTGTEGNIDPDNRWATRLLVGRNENADGFSDYTAGFTPDVAIEEDYTNLGVLGETSDPLLAAALAQISGSVAKGIDLDLPSNRESTRKINVDPPGMAVRQRSPFR